LSAFPVSTTDTGGVRSAAQQQLHVDDQQSNTKTKARLPTQSHDFKQPAVFLTSVDDYKLSPARGVLKIVRPITHSKRMTKKLLKFICGKVI